MFSSSNIYFYAPVFNIEAHAYLTNYMAFQNFDSNALKIDGLLRDTQISKRHQRQEDLKQSLLDLKKTEDVISVDSSEDEKKNSSKTQCLIRADSKLKIDEQYFPQRKDFSKARQAQTQSQSRNIIPNVAHQIVSCIQQAAKSRKTIEKILQHQNCEKASVKRFVLYQKLIKERLNHYLNLQSLEMFLRPLEVDNQIFSIEERLVYCKVSRILIKKFLDEELVLLTLTSSKIKRSNRLLHIKTKGTILEKIARK